jgi:hypothetical protein
METKLTFAKYSSTHAHRRSGEPCTGGHGELLADANPAEHIRAFCSDCLAHVVMGLVHVVPMTVSTS